MSLSLQDNQTSFRPEIEGLRGVAVGAVLLFHFDFKLFFRGYLGVDAFFVLSGYLITRLLQREIESNGRVSFRRFYLRRLRRLYPTMLMVGVVSAVMSWFFLLPHQLEAAGSSLTSTVLSFSNFYFWSQDGYFDASSISKPLLHTWSLSVEEQFYLVWPALIGLAYPRLSSEAFRRLLVAIGLASLAATAWYSGDLGDLGAEIDVDDVSGTFYLPWFRVYEFVAGALVVSAERRIALRGRFANAVSVAGLLLLIGCFVLPSELFDLASGGGLVASLGTTLVLLAGASGFAQATLCLALVRFFGKISYSLYLWHWPLWVIYVNSSDDSPNALMKISLLGVTTAISIASYYFIEEQWRPIPKGRSSQGFVVANAALVAALASAGVFIGINADQAWASSGKASVALQRQAESSHNALMEYNYGAHARVPNAFSNNGKPKLLIVGDSMAADLINALAETGAVTRFDAAKFIVSAKCQPLYGIPFSAIRSSVRKKAREHCEKRHEELEHLELLKRAELVIVAASTANWALPHYQQAVKNFRNHGARVLVIGPKQLERSGLDFALTNFSLSPEERAKRFRFADFTLSANEQLGKMLPEDAYIDVVKVFCPAEGVCTTLSSEGASLYVDTMHLSQEGARYWGLQLEKHPVFLKATQGIAH